MNQKGFATVLGLCLIMAIALCVKGIQEAQMNQSYVTTDFQAEIALQNAAESGIYLAVDKIRQELAVNKDYLKTAESHRNYHQIPVFSTTQKTSRGDISVDVQAERILIFPYEVNYTIRSNGKYRANKISDGKELKDHEVYTVSSSAGIYIEHIGKKIYRNAFAYVELDADGNSDTTIHFMDNTKILDNDFFYRPNDDPTK